MYGGQSAGRLRQEIRAALRAAARAPGVKFQASLGNHDRPEQVNYKLYNMNGQRYYTYARNNVRFFALDSNADGSEAARRGSTRRCATRARTGRSATSIIRCTRMPPATARRSICACCSSRSSSSTASTSCFPGTITSTSASSRRRASTTSCRARRASCARGNMRSVRPDRGVLRSGSELHAGGSRRRGHVLSGDLAHRPDGRFGRDSPAAEPGATAPVAPSARGAERASRHQPWPTNPPANTPRARRVARTRRAAMRRWRASVPRLSQFAVEHLLLLPLGAAIALLWVNTLPESYYRFTFAIAFAVNDVAMVFFFALMTKEVVEATAPGGVLHPWRRALLPVIAAIGATMVPALMHVYAVERLDEPMLAVGWPVTFATDIAVSYFIARIIFRRHPAIPFLLLLGDRLRRARVPRARPVPSRRRPSSRRSARLIMAVALAVAFGAAAGCASGASGRTCSPPAASRGTRSIWSGLHPALALVPIMPFLPHAARDPGFFVDAQPDGARRAESVRGLVEVSGAGGAVLLRARQRRRAASRARGRHLGPADRRHRRQAARHPDRGRRARSPPGCTCRSRVGWRDLIVVGFIAAIGFSVGLFFCAALLPPGQLRSETEHGRAAEPRRRAAGISRREVLRVGRFART